MMNLDPYRSELVRGGKPLLFPAESPVLQDPAPLGGRYRLEAPLGHGTGSVFRAKDLKTGTRHAIKRLPRDAALQAGEYDRFVSEITLLSQLCHPHIVGMSALHSDATGRPFLVMELLAGEDVLTHLAGGQRLSLPRVLHITRQVASALHAAHLCGMAHRAFRLSSIFLGMQAGLAGQQVEVVKVVGFGGVKVRGLLGQLAQDLGGPDAEYLAPEGMCGSWLELDALSDQWALAVAVFRMLSGQLPFSADGAVALKEQICTRPPLALGELCPELPQHVVETLYRALAKDKAQRFPSTMDFLRALSGQTRSPVVQAAVKLPTPADAPPPVITPAPLPDLAELAKAPISLSEVPTLAIKIDPDRTLPIEPGVLAQLCAATQVSARRRLLPASLEYSLQVQLDAPPMLPTATPAPLFTLATQLAQPALPAVPAQPSAPALHDTKRLPLIALFLGSCIGLSLGTTAVLRHDWRGHRSPVMERKAVVIAKVQALPSASPVTVEPLPSIERPIEPPIALLQPSVAAPVFPVFPPAVPTGAPVSLPEKATAAQKVTAPQKPVPVLVAKRDVIPDVLPLAPLAAYLGTVRDRVEAPLGPGYPSEVPTIQPAVLVVDAGAGPSAGEKDLIPARLAGEAPRLALVVRRLYQHESVVAIYRLCVQPSGAVASVSPVAGIPFDDDIKHTLQSWRYAPGARQACVDQELRFEVEE